VVENVEFSTIKKETIWKISFIFHGY